MCYDDLRVEDRLRSCLTFGYRCIHTHLQLCYHTSRERQLLQTLQSTAIAGGMTIESCKGAYCKIWDL